MNYYRCIILTGCTTEEVVYAYMPSFLSSAYGFWVSELGNVVKVNVGAPFSETYYTVSSLCTVEDFDGNPCEDCQTAITEGTAYTFALDPVTELPINVESTGTDECPASAYVLVNCKNFREWSEPLNAITQSPQTVLVTNTNLEFYVGSVVTIAEYPDNCYTVFGPYNEDTGCPCDVYTVTNSYQDCECCIPDTAPKYQPRILDPVKVFYRILQDRCDINANIKFSQGYYQYFKSVAYGMGTCCDNVDLEKLWMKKRLSDLSQIYDPNACVVPPTPEEPLQCEGPDGTLCAPPTNVSAELNF
jgi:hypothetical protein